MKYEDNMLDPCTGVLLTPALHGEGCPGNGTNPDLECCCDECDYYLECFQEWDWVEKTGADSDNVEKKQ